MNKIYENLFILKCSDSKVLQNIFNIYIDGTTHYEFNVFKLLGVSEDYLDKEDELDLVYRARELLDTIEMFNKDNIDSFTNETLNCSVMDIFKTFASVYNGLTEANILPPKSLVKYLKEVREVYPNYEELKSIVDDISEIHFSYTGLKFDGVELIEDLSFTPKKFINKYNFNLLTVSEASNNELDQYSNLKSDFLAFTIPTKYGDGVEIAKKLKREYGLIDVIHLFSGNGETTVEYLLNSDNDTTNVSITEVSYNDFRNVCDALGIIDEDELVPLATKFKWATKLLFDINNEEQEDDFLSTTPALGVE